MTAGAVAAAVGALVGEAVLVADAGRPVRRLGLALEPEPGLAAWAVERGLDALLLHRWWGFEPPTGMSVIGCHDGFDATFGLDGEAAVRALAGAAAAARGRRLAPKLVVADADPDRVVERARVLFGAQVELRGTVPRAGAGAPAARAAPVAFASALRPELVLAAAVAGSVLYVTGTWRPAAAEAIAERGLPVLLVGHEPAERWALEHLAAILGRELAGVAVEVRRP